MLPSPKDGIIEAEKVVTYADVYVYCQTPMGSVSMLNVFVRRKRSLQAQPASAEEFEALHALKDAACNLVEHIERESGCQPQAMDEQLLETALTPSAKALYDIMIERQHELQRLTGQPEGPVPVSI